VQIAGTMVFFMQGGFALLEVSKKQALQTLSRSYQLCWKVASHTGLN